jgi:hypothetical protein
MLTGDFLASAAAGLGLAALDSSFAPQLLAKSALKLKDAGSVPFSRGQH